MRGGALPPALICAALAFALSFAPSRIFAPALLILVAISVAASFLPIHPGWDDGVFFACWISVVLTAGAVHLPKGIGPKLALVLAVNAGLWAGAVIAATGSSGDLLKALPFGLLCLPGYFLVAKKKSIVLKVIASWLVAVAILAAGLSITTITPGYEPDHLE